MDAFDEVKNIVEKLIDSSESAYHINKSTGVDQSIIGRIRKGERKIENMRFESIGKLYKYAKKAEKN